MYLLIYMPVSYHFQVHNQMVLYWLYDLLYYIILLYRILLYLFYYHGCVCLCACMGMSIWRPERSTSVPPNQVSLLNSRTSSHPTVPFGRAVTSHCSFSFCLWPPANLLALSGGGHCLFCILHIKKNHKYVCLCWLFSNTKPFRACVKYAHACMFTCVSVGTWAPWHKSGGQMATLAVWPRLPAGWRPALLLFTAVHTRLTGPCAYQGSGTSTPISL